MTDPNIPALIAALRNPQYQGPRQHLRSWNDLDTLHVHVLSALEAQAQEMERLRAGGCARDQTTTQFCAEAAAMAAELDALRAKLAAAGAVVQAARHAMAPLHGLDQDQIRKRLSLVGAIKSGDLHALCVALGNPKEIST